MHQNTKAFRSRYNLGLACSSASQHVAAIEQFKIAKGLIGESHTRLGSIHNSLGWAYLQSGDYTNAIRELRQAREPALYSKLSEIARRQVDNNLALAESYLNSRSVARN